MESAARTQVLVAWTLGQASFLTEDFLCLHRELPSVGHLSESVPCFPVLGQEPEEHLRAVLLCTEGRAAPHSSSLRP